MEEPKVVPVVQPSGGSQSRIQSVKMEEPKVVPGDEDEDEDAFSFGPEWLKSLGATAIDDPDPAEIFTYNIAGSITSTRKIRGTS